MDGQTGRHRETDGQIDRVGMMMKKKPWWTTSTLSSVTGALCYKNTLVLVQMTHSNTDRFLMPLGIIKLSLLNYYTTKYLLFKMVNITA